MNSLQEAIARAKDNLDIRDYVPNLDEALQQLVDDVLEVAAQTVVEEIEEYTAIKNAQDLTTDHGNEVWGLAVHAGSTLTDVHHALVAMKFNQESKG